VSAVLYFRRSLGDQAGDAGDLMHAVTVTAGVVDAVGRYGKGRWTGPAHLPSFAFGSTYAVLRRLG
jgi:hypothetical protein